MGEALLEAPVQLQRLAERGQPGGGGGGGHRAHRIGLIAGEVQAAHHREDQQRAGDIDRSERQPDPVIGAGDAVLHFGDAIERQHGEGEQERHDIEGVDTVLQQPHHADAEQGEEGADPEGRASGRR